MEILDSTSTTLRSIGKDELWLQTWILEKPSRLGLGEMEIIEYELRQYKGRGGRLDILAYQADIDTYYEIELMLGECDSDHGFRTLDYWARQRLELPNSRHIAVLVAEDLSGRYKTIIETLPQFLPFIGIELQVLRIPYQQGIAIIQPTIVAQPDDLILDMGDEPDGKSHQSVAPKDRDWWVGKESAAYIAAVDKIILFCQEEVGTSRIDYSAQSYISLKKGNRCWLPMWPRSNGVYVYLPGGKDGAADAPSDFFNRVAQKLQAIGLDSPSWTYKYNAGANPVGFGIPLEKVNHSAIKEIIAEAYSFI
ncbi:MAG: hypothetical protein KDE59_04895 [Anaerolineales bacterium]|nr:hypothetical protein [Anaerolineales bacterium]